MRGDAARMLTRRSCEAVTLRRRALPGRRCRVLRDMRQWRSPGWSDEVGRIDSDGTRVTSGFDLVKPKECKNSKIDTIPRATSEYVTRITSSRQTGRCQARRGR